MRKNTKDMAQRETLARLTDNSRRLMDLETKEPSTTFANGISFGDETLSVYDQGTWTPAITGSTGNPTLTYTLQTGQYTRIGNLVFYNFVVTVNVISVAGSGDVRISIPFTDNSAGGCPAVAGFAGVDLPGTPVSTEFRTRQGQAYGRLICNQDNGAQQILSHTGLADGDSFIVNGHFFV